MRYFGSLIALCCFLLFTHAAQDDPAKKDLKTPAQADWPPRTTIEELNAMVKAGNYHLIRKEKIAHQIEAVGIVEKVGHFLMLKLPGGWWAHLHHVPVDSNLKPGDRVRFRALILDEAYRGLQLWTYSWSKANDGEGETGPWNPALIEGGFMFKDAEAFGNYLRKAEIVAVGRLTSWDGKDGKVRVEKVFRGTALEEQSFRYSGGLVNMPAKGNKVVVLLRTREGHVVLHSFCAASGLFPSSKGLEKVVEKQLPAKGG